MDKYLKLLKRLGRLDRGKLGILIEDIVIGNLSKLDSKKLRGFKDLYRVRCGKIRIVYKKGKVSNIIINIDYRNKIYKTR